MSQHFNALSPGEAELLACLAEEAAEVIQVVGKILRHGYESTYPECGTSNRDMLERELGDFRAITSMMVHRGHLCGAQIISAKEAKKKRVQKYLHHQNAGK